MAVSGAYSNKRKGPFSDTQFMLDHAKSKPNNNYYVGAFNGKDQELGCEIISGFF